MHELFVGSGQGILPLADFDGNFPIGCVADKFGMRRVQNQCASRGAELRVIEMEPQQGVGIK